MVEKESHPPAIGHLKNALGVSIVNEAELVFTTLDSAGSAVFRRLPNRFDVVLIDEAAQASELQTSFRSPTARSR